MRAHRVLTTRIPQRLLQDCLEGSAGAGGLIAAVSSQQDRDIHCGQDGPCLVALATTHARQRSDPSTSAAQADLLQPASCSHAQRRRPLQPPKATVAAYQPAAAGSRAAGQSPWTRRRGCRPRAWLQGLHRGRRLPEGHAAAKPTDRGPTTSVAYMAAGPSASPGGIGNGVTPRGAAVAPEAAVAVEAAAPAPLLGAGAGGFGGGLGGRCVDAWGRGVGR